MTAAKSAANHQFFDGTPSLRGITNHRGDGTNRGRVPRRATTSTKRPARPGTSIISATQPRPGRPGFYSFDLGSWHIVSLNSNIAIDEPSAQLQWLRRDLSSNRARCTLAFWHHPLFSSGPNGADTRMRPLWEVLYAEGADVVLNGHEHMYERFGPQHPSGRADATGGIRQFTIGTGGAHLGQVQLARPNSEARAAVWGVLKLTLQDAGYTWEFRAVAGESFRDAGSDLCH